MTWQPIETAPKREWPPILVCDASKSRNYPDYCVVSWKGYWAMDTGCRAGSWDDELLFEPTHWMPIPELQEEGGTNNE
jgi:hypothetical protein